METLDNLSKAWLRVDPTFDPVRKLPAFQGPIGVTR